MSERSGEMIDDSRGGNKYSLETIPLSTLIYYLKKDDILDNILRPEMKQAVELIAVEQKKRLTKSLIKEWIASQDPGWQQQFSTFVKQSQYGEAAFDRYLESVARLKDPVNKEKSLQARRAAADAKKGFLGCLATKVNPREFTYCGENFDNPEFQFDIVPNAVHANALYKAGLTDKIPDPRHISYLPTGLRRYMAKNPLLFEDYLEERQAEVKFLQSVRRNALNALYSGQSQLTIDVPLRKKNDFIDDDLELKKRKK